MRIAETEIEWHCRFKAANPKVINLKQQLSIIYVMYATMHSKIFF